MFALVTVKVADITSPTGGGCITLDPVVLQDIILGAIIDEGFEDASVHVTVVPDEEDIPSADADLSGMIVVDGDYTPEERQTNMERVFRALYGGE